MQKIKGYSCPKCGWSDISVVEVCPRCRGKIEEQWFSGKGKIATFTIIRYPPKEFEGKAPYIVAMIDLENGPRTIGRIIDHSGNLEIGQVVSFRGKSDGTLEFGL
jgi:uncharacterized OB-fold protein